MYLIRLTFNGATVLAYAVDEPEGDANSLAGRLMDSMADNYGDGFGYRVEPLYCLNAGAALQMAMNAFERGAWQGDACKAIAAAACRLRTLAAELESGVKPD